MRTKCEVWSRSVGYLRPVEQWNDGKQQEFKDRKVFNVDTRKPKEQGTVNGDNEKKKPQFI